MPRQEEKAQEAKRHKKRLAWVAQLAEHVFGKDEVSGSIPDSGSLFSYHFPLDK